MNGMPPMPGVVSGAGMSPMPMPAAPTPNSIGATPGVQGVSAPMTPEHKAELQELLSKVKQEYMKWQSMKFGIQNTANENRRDQLKRVFQILQAKGVDLNNPKSVSEFLAKLKQTAPQHFDAITKALDYLLGSDYENQQTPDESQQPLPDQNVSPEPQF